MKVVFGCVFINIIYGAPETAICSRKMGRLLRAYVAYKCATKTQQDGLRKYALI